MSHLDQLFDQLASLPEAALVAQRLNALLEAEAEKRRQFYELVHEDVNAEFINGDVVFQSPVKKKHWEVCTNLSTFLNYHVLQTKTGIVGTEKVMIRLTRNDYEPDICFFNREKAAAFTPDQLLFPAPDFIVEVTSESTRRNDYGVKFNDYAAHGVTEYWIVDPDAQSIEQYLLENGEYVLQQKLLHRGLLQAMAVAGFEIELERIFGT
jgi:Uma2 family endonuclease